jgi:predicted TIM-barrel fold metal-dependent hydrolase
MREIMSAVQLIIDADSHVTEPRDVWTARVPSRYVADVPHVERLDGMDTWVLQGKRLGLVGVTAPAGWPSFPPEFPPRFEDCHLGAYDAQARLGYMDEAGIWAQVLYPNVGGFGSENFLGMTDDALKLICVQAYNDFLHEWCSVGPGRLLPVLATPFWDIQATVDEVIRCAGLGARGILFTGEPQRYGLPVIGHPHWNPLWAVATETRMPIHFHIGNAGDLPQLLTPERYEHHGIAATQAYGAVDLFLKNGVQCADLITSGMLARWPELKFVSVESGMGWLPFMLEAADYSWLGAFRPGRQRTSDDILPSELFRDHVYVTYWFEQVAPNHMLDLVPIDNVLFETDFPHTTCLFGNIGSTIEANLGHVPEEVRRKILWENAARLYGIASPPPGWPPPGTGGAGETRT